MTRDRIDPNDAKPTGDGYYDDSHDGDTEAGCDDDNDRCAPSDYDPDPYADKNVPGTPDDLPTTLGEERPDPNDEHIIPADAPVYAKAGKPKGDDTSPLGAEDEADLWRKQKHLIQEDDKEGLKLDGFSDDEAKDVLDALGDDAAEAYQDSPNGVSATGMPFEPEHGGFPERSE